MPQGAAVKHAELEPPTGRRKMDRAIRPAEPLHLSGAAFCADNKENATITLKGVQSKQGPPSAKPTNGNMTGGRRLGLSSRGGGGNSESLRKPLSDRNICSHPVDVRPLASKPSRSSRSRKTRKPRLSTSVLSLQATHEVSPPRCRRPQPDPPTSLQRMRH